MSKSTLKEICYSYYLNWKRMEEIRELSGGFSVYGSFNSERIRLHEELLDTSGLEREELSFLTNSMYEVKSKVDFYNKVLAKVLEKKAGKK